MHAESDATCVWNCLSYIHKLCCPTHLPAYPGSLLTVKVTRSSCVRRHPVIVGVWGGRYRLFHVRPGSINPLMLL